MFRKKTTRNINMGGVWSFKEDLCNYLINL